MKGRCRGRDGFTMLETIAVLVLLGIMAAVAGMRSPRGETDVDGAADQLAAHLRYAQARSMASDSSLATPEFYTSLWGIYFSDAANYGLFFCDNPSSCAPATSLRILPGSENNLVTSDANVTYGTAALSFDKFGRPYLAGVATPAAANIDFTVSKNGYTRIVTVYAETGFVEVHN
jgi:prepilin-type N-terminal cleavage/methylation domain-containing protein